MNRFLRIIDQLLVGFLAVILLAVVWSPDAEAATRKVKCAKDDLQSVIAAAVSGDTIELSGVCQGNFRIDGKDLTLVGANSPGPHGIKGVAADTAALTVLRSNRSSIQNLSINDSADGGVLIDYSNVTMTDCTANNNAGRGISVHQSSFFSGLRLQINGNASGGLLALNGSRVDCLECELTDNLNFAAVSNVGSLMTLLDSTVSGKTGLNASFHSYLDIDCVSWETTHDCSLHATQMAGRAVEDSTVAFYGTGDFDGALLARGRSAVQLVGARQQSTGWVSDSDHSARNNGISDNASLRVDPYSEDGELIIESSRLMGTTHVSEFSHALLSGGSTVLDGSLNCSSAGDAWVEAGVVFTPGSITGCEHAP